MLARSWNSTLSARTGPDPWDDPDGSTGYEKRSVVTGVYRWVKTERVNYRNLLTKIYIIIACLSCLLPFFLFIDIQ